jgi:DNA-binding winged helix-turn-helix (wHTH) protein
MQEHDPPRTLAFHPTARSVVHFGPFRFDLADGLLAREGEEIRLPPRALAILQHLVERAGRIVPKQALIDAAWKDAYVSETSLTEAVGLVRQALGDDPQKPAYIQTVHRRGYRFIAPVTTEAPATQPVAVLDPPVESPALPAAISTGPPQLEAATGTPARPRTALAILLVLVLAAAGALGWLALTSGREQPVARLSLTLPAEQAPAPALNAHPVATISPDGQRIVYVAGMPGTTRLFVRRMDRFEATPLAGTEGAHGPFFSPDGAWVAFFSDGRLMKVRPDGGEPQVLCATPTGVGGTWLSDEAIVFAPDWTGPLMRVPASGGEPEVAATPLQGYSYRWPDRVDDRTVLATRWRATASDAAVVALSLASGTEQVIAERAMFGRSVQPGAVMFVRDGDVYAVRIDPATHAPRGSPVRVLPAVLAGTTGAAQLAIAPNGTLLYLPAIADRAKRILARVNGQGRSRDLPIAPRVFRNFATCGNRIAVTIYEAGQSNLWTGHLDRAALTRITGQGSAYEPVWSADCRMLAFGWNLAGVSNIYTVRADSGEAPSLVAASPAAQVPGSWSADGMRLAYIETRSRTLNEIWILDRTTGRPSRFESPPAQKLLPRLSPDGRWLAYESDGSGRFEIEVASVARGSRVQVSTGGGIWPAWSADGTQLFFLNAETIFSAAISERDGEVVAGNPVPLFSHPDLLLFRPAGDEFVWLRRTAEHLPLTRIDLVLGWFSELDRQLR